MRWLASAIPRDRSGHAGVVDQTALEARFGRSETPGLSSPGLSHSRSRHCRACLCFGDIPLTGNRGPPTASSPRRRCVGTDSAYAIRRLWTRRLAPRLRRVARFRCPGGAGSAWPGLSESGRAEWRPEPPHRGSLVTERQCGQRPGRRARSRSRAGRWPLLRGSDRRLRGHRAAGSSLLLVVLTRAC